MLIGTPLIFNNGSQLSAADVALSPLPDAVGSQLFAALVTGLLIAFGLQLLLTNLGLAIGISVVRFRSRLTHHSQPSQPQQVDNPSHYKKHPVHALLPSKGVLAGIGLLSTINLVLFIACFLAVRFSQVDEPISGAILGIVIWAAYCLILLWLSTSAATSLFSAALGFTATGIGGLIALIRNVLKPKSKTSELNQATLATLQQLQLRLDPANLQQLLEDYSAQLNSAQLNSTQLNPPQLDWDRVRADLQALLHQPEIRFLATQWQQVDRAQVMASIQQRFNFSNQEVNQIMNVIDNAWQQEDLDLLEQNDESQSNKLEDNELESNELESNELESSELKNNELQNQLELYLRHTAPKRLTPKRVERKLHKLLQSVQLEFAQPSTALPKLDTEALTVVLQRRKGLSQKQQRQILQQIEQTWQQASRSATLAQNDDQRDAATATLSIPAETMPAEKAPETASVEAIEVLLASLISYFSPLSELPQATERLRQYLKEWLTDLQTNPSMVKETVQAMAERMSVETLDDNLEQWYATQLQPWRERLQTLSAELVPHFQDSSHVADIVQTSIRTQLEAIQQQLFKPIEPLQHYLQSQLDSIQQQVQQSTQRAATAAWWLFTIGLTAALSSAIAGVLASGG